MTQGDLLGEGGSPAPAGRRQNVRIGLCSWSDPSLIKSKAFYPRGSGTPEGRLRFYAQNFPVVEVDSSFYALPDPANSVKWVERTPENFRFNIKAFRLLTGHQTQPEVFPPDIVAALPPHKRGKRNHYIADLPAEVVDEVWRHFILAVAPLKDANKLLAVHFQFAPWAELTDRIDSVVDNALDVVVLLNVTQEDHQGVRAAQALERRQKRIMERSP